MALIFWKDETRDELKMVLPHSVVVLPTGAIEQHGPYLGTGHDTICVGAIAFGAAMQASDQISLVLAPTLEFGSSDHHLPFGGTLSLTTDTYLLVIRDLLRSLVLSGARRIFLLNGHGGNEELNRLAARDIALQPPGGAPVAIAAASYWEIARKAFAAEPLLAGMPIPGHAGQFETAMRMAVETENIRTPWPERGGPTGAASTIDGVRLEVTGLWESFDGFTDFPYRATEEQGKAALQHSMECVRDALIALSMVELT